MTVRARTVVLTLFVAVLMISCAERREAPTVSETPSRNQETVVDGFADPRVRTIASNFACPCGGCEHDHLLDRRCEMPNGALETISMIQSRLATGDDVAEAIEYISVRFPHARHEGPAIETHAREFPAERVRRQAVKVLFRC